MAAKTTTANGNWSAGATWTGGVVPVPGDTVTISHAVVHDNTLSFVEERIIGHSPGASHATAALLISPGGSLTISQSTRLIVRGDIKQNNAPITVNGDVCLDPSLATTPATAFYVWQIGTAFNQPNALLTIQGSGGIRAIVRSNMDPGMARARFTTGDSAYGCQIHADTFELHGVADATNDATDVRLASGQIPPNQFYLRNGVVNGCGRIVTTGLHTDHTGDLQNVTFKNSAHATQSASLPWGGFVSGTGIKRIDGCVFDKEVVLTVYGATDIDVTNSVFLAVPDLTSEPLTTGTLVWRFNLVRAPATTPTFTVQHSAAEYSYLLQDHTTANPHGLHPSPNASVALNSWVVEYTGTDTAGDCIVIPSPGVAQVYALAGCLILPNGAGVSSGTLFSALGNDNVTFSASHNTAFLGALNSGGKVGETEDGHADMLTAFAHNLLWDNTSARGYKLSKDSAAIVSGYVTVAGCVRNGGFNVLTGDGGVGYNGLNPAAAGYGAGDVNGVDPLFVDPTRDLAAWDAFMGGPGTVAHAMEEFLRRNDWYNPSKYTPSQLYNWVYEGFVPRASAYNVATDSHAWIGAMRGVVEAPILSIASGAWSDTGTWAGGNVPGATETARIVAPHVVTGTATTTVGTGGNLYGVALTIDEGATLSLTGGEWTFNGNVHVHGTLSVSGSAGITMGNYLCPPELGVASAAGDSNLGREIYLHATGSMTCTGTASDLVTITLANFCQITGPGSLTDWTYAGIEGGRPTCRFDPVSQWEYNMVKKGLQWADFFEDNPSLGVDGFNHQYYDVAWGMWQAYEYTGLAQFNTAARIPCTYYKAYIQGTTPDGAIPSYNVHTRGLAEDFTRNADAAGVASKQAALDVSTNATFAGDGVADSATDSYTVMREAALTLHNYIVCETYLGQSHRTRYAALVTDLYDHIEQVCVDEVWDGDSSLDAQAFMLALVARSLILDWQTSDDARLIPALTTMAEWLWANAWNARAGAMYLNANPAFLLHGFGSETVPAVDLNLLIAPLFAFLWAENDDATQRDRYDLLFSNGARYGYLDQFGKHWGQAYLWSFEGQAWRTTTPSEGGGIDTVSKRFSMMGGP